MKKIYLRFNALVPLYKYYNILNVLLVYWSTSTTVCRICFLTPNHAVIVRPVVVVYYYSTAVVQPVGFDPWNRATRT
jgi:hypothetical protein